MTKKDLINAIFFSVLFIAFTVCFSNWQTEKALKIFKNTCKGRFDTSYNCITNGICDCKKGHTND